MRLATISLFLAMLCFRVGYAQECQTKFVAEGNFLLPIDTQDIRGWALNDSLRNSAQAIARELVRLDATCHPIKSLNVYGIGDDHLWYRDGKRRVPPEQNHWQHELDNERADHFMEYIKSIDPGLDFGRITFKTESYLSLSPDTNVFKIGPHRRTVGIIVEYETEVAEHTHPFPEHTHPIPPPSPPQPLPEHTHPLSPHEHALVENLSIGVGHTVHHEYPSPFVSAEYGNERRGIYAFGGVSPYKDEQVLKTVPHTLRAWIFGGGVYWHPFKFPVGLRSGFYKIQYASDEEFQVAVREHGLEIGPELRLPLGAFAIKANVVWAPHARTDELSDEGSAQWLESMGGVSILCTLK